ncbi:polyadenylate-binding protein 2-like [Gastrolobium bilobum]|uniref:polyadenylate-binding protein 2-like n=1 Tax=Gastrolobium bilobum TaxID=150636 RepID=UPI002AB221A0|nr:polyadenylate-binding protein 2-like [Gastrolobium bilobum]
MVQVNESLNADAEVPTPAHTENQNPTPNQLMHTALYIEDLDRNVIEYDLYELFNPIGEVASVRICRDYITDESRGFGYVNFTHAQDAAKAIDELNFTPLNNKPIRIMLSNRGPDPRRSSAANIFIKNLAKEIDDIALHETFSSFGKILSCKVATDDSGESKGYGFVQFEKEESAQNAIEKLNRMLINDKKVYVGRFLRKQDRERAKFNNLYVKNLSESTTDEDLQKTFGEYGTVISAVVMREEDGTSKCFGFASFERADAATKAQEALNGKRFDGKKWYVGKALKKSERLLELKGRYGESSKGSAGNYQDENLYVENLDHSVTDEKLRELFSEFGIITTCKVMRSIQGFSRGWGFVAFSTPEEATRALNALNGQMFARKPLHFTVARRNEEGRVTLQAQFSQIRPVATAPSVANRLSMHHPRAPGLGPQSLYRQPRPPFIDQAGFGYPRQLVPGMGPRVPPLPNFFPPIVPPGQLGQRPAMQQFPRPLPWMQPIAPMGRDYRYPPGRNLIDTRLPPLAGRLTSTYDVSSQPIENDAEQPIIPFDVYLENTRPEIRRIILGEVLYPLVDELEHESAPKVTGMLLEMDHNEVIHLIESADDLKTKVAEAMYVLRNHERELSNEQLVSLFLDDDS